MVLRLRIPPDSAYPPGTSDHGTLTFMIAVIVLGIISVLAGVASMANWFNNFADKGHKRGFFRYTFLYIDIIFAGLAGVAMWVSQDTSSSGMSLHSPDSAMKCLTIESLQHAINNLGDKGTRCLANMSTYQGCVMLMALVVMVGLGALIAAVSTIMELTRIHKWKKTARNG